jgi:hypothetical protein
MTAVRLTVAAQPAVLGACELCAAGPERLAEAVVVQHADGAAVAFAACERCARAAGRIAAAIGRDADVITAAAGGFVTGTAPPRRPRRLRVEPELIREYVEQIADADGTRYVVRVYGQPRSDGTWVGWLAFLGVGAATVLRTGVETTQASRGHLAHWASGLEPTYLGAVSA